MPSSVRGAVPTVAFPWGPEGSITWEIPAGWARPEIFWPDLQGAVDDYAAALNEALDRPLGGMKLEGCVRSGSRVAVVVDDPSRWTPVREALRVVLDRLVSERVRREDISISVGVGRHRALDEAALKRHLGEDVVASHPCHSPPLDEVAHYVDLGKTVEGVPVRVFRPVAQADLRVLIGSVLPHLQAGFGGGYKLILPGCSHRSTLGALHRQGFGDGERSAGALLGGAVTTNPMRRAIQHAAELLRGPSFSISHVMGPAGCVLRVAAGDVEAVQEQLSDEARQRFAVNVPAPADAVVVGNYPWPGDPMMSFKVLLNHRSAVRRGGVLVGLFWTDAAEIDRTVPLGTLRAIAASGAAGGWFIRGGLRMAEAVVSALRSPKRFMLRWARDLVADRRVLVYAPTLAERIGRHLGPVLIHTALTDLAQPVEKSLGGKPQSVSIFPYGGLSYVEAPRKSG